MTSFIEKAKQNAAKQSAANNQTGSVSKPKMPGFFKPVGKIPGRAPGSIPKIPGKPSINVPKKPASEAVTPDPIPDTPLSKNNKFLKNMPDKIEETKEKVKAKDSKAAATLEKEISNVEEVPAVKEVTTTPVIEKTVEEKTKAETKKKKSKKTTKKEIEEAVEVTYDDIPKSSISFNDAIKLISENYQDEEFLKYKEEVTEKFKDIIITADMGVTANKQVISALDELRSAIIVEYINVKNTCEMIAKEMEVIKNLSYVGVNDAERKINSTRALMNYVRNGEKINYLEISTGATVRLNFLQDIINGIEFKKNCCITMLGNIKASN